MGEFDELIEEFVTESKEHIADIEDDLIRIESDMENVDPEVINRVFRAAHSIKGSSKFLDLVNIGELAHRMEDVLNLIRSGKLSPTSEVASVLLLSADTLKTMLDDVNKSNDMDISEPLRELQKILDSPETVKGGAKSACAYTNGPSPLAAFDVEPSMIRGKLASSQVYVITLTPGSCDIEHVLSELGNLGEVIAESAANDGSLSVLFSTIMEPDMLPLALGVPRNAYVQIDESMLKAVRAQPKAAPDEKAKPRPKATPRPMQAARPEAPAANQTREPVLTGECSEISYDDADTQGALASLNEDIRAARASENTSYITFTLDNENYAVPIQSIEEIIGLQEISLLPNVPDFIKGVINLRGEIVPIMDLRIKFGLPPKEYNQFTVFLIMRVDERLMGLVVDNVADVLVIDPSKVQKRPSFSAKISTAFINGVYKDSQDELVILMDVPALIRPEEWEADRPRA
ncbi:MAG TPA: chemotaxis protein CheW [Deltaproteobacteria bacterium]|nr:chemotaxis protein CheW [Deltaproteobacteria bacterium]HPP81281.1 chemotaxis protein CheW [Deltaproteobacteria bacterium]